MKRIAEGIIGTKPDETRGLGLFTPPPAPVAHVEGAGQSARKAARPDASTSAANRHTLALLLEAHGPLTRSEMARLTGWPKDSCNGRVAEARNLPVGHADRMLTDGRREGESLVHLARKHSLTFSEG